MMKLKQRLMTKNNKGFTLIELVIVIVILAILAAIAIPAMNDYMEKANRSKVFANGRSAYMAANVVLGEDIAAGTSTITTIDTSKLAALANLPADNISDITVSSNKITAFTYTESSYTVSLDSSGVLVITP